MIKPWHLLIIVFFTAACAHNTHEGFAKFIREHPTQEDRLNVQAGYSIGKSTMQMTYSFRSVMGGIANTYKVNVGSMIKDFMDEAGLRFFERIQAEPEPTKPIHLKIDARDYAFEDMQAYVAIHASVYENGSLVFEKVYSAKGIKQTGKMFWGGAAGIRHSVHQSTQYALNEIFREIVSDIRKLR